MWQILTTLSKHNHDFYASWKCDFDGMNASLTAKAKPNWITQPPKPTNMNTNTDWLNNEVKCNSVWLSGYLYPWWPGLNVGMSLSATCCEWELIHDISWRDKSITKVYGIHSTALWGSYFIHKTSNITLNSGSSCNHMKYANSRLILANIQAN